jgi:hypothetical protein
LHDAIIGERLGLPSVGIMTSSFVSAADMMARALGAPGYRYVVIDHPISSASLSTLAERAEKAADECAAILRGRSAKGSLGT